MRRISAFLMIAALVAVLVPSAALAGKPAPTITSVVVSSTGPLPNTAWCGLNLEIVFDGRAYQALITESTGRTLTSAADNRLGNANMGWGITVESLATQVISWDVVMQDRKGNPIGTAVTTSAENVSACPSVWMEELAHYTYTP